MWGFGFVRRDEGEMFTHFIWIGLHASGSCTLLHARTSILRKQN